MKRWDLINTLIKNKNYQNYLEIGYGVGENFKKINIDKKISVDPHVSVCTHNMSSDDFFEKNKETYDLIFIDGLHLYEQVKKDFYNSISILNEGGTIVIHDCNPSTYEMQKRESGGGEWTGDVWKLIVHLRNKHDDLKVCVIDTDYGCGIVRVGEQKTIEFDDEITYEIFSENRKEILNLVSVDEFMKSLI